MKILSNFHDYYDSLRTYDKDDILYIRKRIELSLITKNCSSHMERWNNRYYEWMNYTEKDEYHIITIGFCDKLYRVVRYLGNFYYEIEKFETEYYANASKKGIKRYEEYGRSWSEGYKNYKDELHHYLNNNGKISTKTCEEYKAPVFYYPNYSRIDENKKIHKVIILNPILRGFEFFKVVDTYTAYQEISMWLGNQAMPEKYIPEISNKDMIEAKGFDLKTSFRKEKSK